MIRGGVVHIYVTNGSRQATLRGTYGLGSWLAEHGFPAYRVYGSLSVPSNCVPDIEATATHEGWLVRMHHIDGPPTAA